MDPSSLPASYVDYDHIQIGREVVFDLDGLWRSMGLDTYLSSALTCKVSCVFHGKLLKLGYTRVPIGIAAQKLLQSLTLCNTCRIQAFSQNTRKLLYQQANNQKPTSLSVFLVISSSFCIIVILCLTDGATRAVVQFTMFMNAVWLNTTNRPQTTAKEHNKGLQRTAWDIGVLWPNGWMNLDAIWYESTPRPMPHCVKWGPSSHVYSGHGRPSQPKWQRVEGPQRSITKDCKGPLGTAKNCIGF